MIIPSKNNLGGISIMFTKIAKVTLWFFIVIGVIMSVVLAVNLSSRGQNFWWIMPVGWIVTFVTASAFGTFVEISDHTRETNELLNRLTNSGGGAPQAGTYNGAPQNNYRGTVSKLSAIANGDTPNNDFWYCTQCGEKNSGNSMVCRGCGKYK